MEVSGIITKINRDLGYGFVKVSKQGEVFFSEDTSYNNTSFQELSENQRVHLEVVETERGLFAKSLAHKSKRSSASQPSL